MDVDMNSITGIPTWNNYYKYMAFNPTLVVIIIVIIIIYLMLFGSLGGSTINDSESNTGGLKILGIIIASLFLVLLLINGFNYFMNIDIITSIKNFFSKKPEIDIIVDNEEIPKITGTDIVPEIKYVDQVYHIPGNKYTYNDAQALCQAYGNRLANYKEIEDAYGSGADWCSYGWSENQLALFPTQYDKWEKLQKIKGHKNDCGRPGINGGYIDNPNIKFGVNCYGFKPKMTRLEGELMEYDALYPATQTEVNFNKKVDHWKTRIQDILVSPFNSKHWSRI
jgi:hypothetical protein